MKKDKTICKHCGNTNDFYMIEKQKSEYVKESEYSYLGKEIYCAVCGHEVHASTIELENKEALDMAYRKANNIITKDEILNIPAKYSIGKRPLSLLLNWGEQTLSRYCDGDIPTRQYSEILKRIDKDPEFYLDILEKNKDKITRISYEKTKKAVYDMTGLQASEKTKIHDVCEYIMYKCEDITPLALQRALYYIEGFYYAFYKESIFKDECTLEGDNFIYDTIYNWCLKKDANRTLSVEGSCDIEFSVSEKSIIDSVIKNLCCYSSNTLKNIVKTEAPYLISTKKIESNDKCIVGKKSIYDYFIVIKEKYCMVIPNDIKSYTKRMFEEV